MRVLFINTFDNRGGAAIAASRLSDILERKYKVESFFLTAYKALDKENSYPLRNAVTEVIEKVIHKISNKIGLQYQFFPFSSAVILKKIAALKPDIISLHNTHGGYFQTSLLSRISTFSPVVWTLHDMWSFTGNAAHTFGDTSWKELKNSPHLTKIYPSIGLNTGRMLLQQKKGIYRRSDLTIVTPSKWLSSLARQSPVFEGKQIVQINNGVDLDVFKICDRNAARAILGIPADAKVLMFSAEQLKGNIWKGGKDLVEVLRISCGKIAGKVHLLVVGAGELESVNELPNVVVHTTGYVRDEKVMASYLSASDVFVYPTRADNLPNVLIEAIACGTPCVTFNIGGCQEIIRNGFNGTVVEPFQLSEMADAIVRLVSREDNAMRENARHHAEEHFSLSSMGEQYHSLFRSILNRKKERVSF